MRALLFTLLCSVASADLIQTGYQNVRSSSTVQNAEVLFDSKPAMPFADWQTAPANWPDSLNVTSIGPDWRVSNDHLFVSFEMDQEYVFDSFHFVQDSIFWVHGQEQWRNQVVDSVELWFHSGAGSFLPRQPGAAPDRTYTPMTSDPYVSGQFEPIRGTKVLAKINATQSIFGAAVDRGAQMAEFRMGGRPAAVPEPSAALMLGLALVGIGLIRRNSNA